MHESIEFAMANILDWKKQYDKFLDVKQFEHEVFVRAFFSEEKERHNAGYFPVIDPAKVWTRALYEESLLTPWPVLKDRSKPEYGVVSICGKYRPINRKALNDVLKEKRRPPIELRLDAVGVKKNTLKGSMYFYITKKEILALTGHVARRLVERSGIPDVKDFTPLAVMHEAYRRMTVVDDAGIIGTTPFGVFLGYRHTLDKAVGSFPQGMTITLCKTFLTMDMLKPEQRKKCHDACMKRVQSMPPEVSKAIIEAILERTKSLGPNLASKGAMMTLTSPSIQATLVVTREGA